MAVCRIISPNRLRDENAEIQDSTFGVSSLPPENLLVPQLAKVARSGSGGANQHVTFDFISAVSVQACAILAHTIPPSPSVLQVAGHSVNNWSSPATGWISLTWHSDKIIKFFSSEYSYRFWRINIDASAQFDLGGVILGPYWESPYDGYKQLSRSSRLVLDGKIELKTYNFGLEQLKQENSEELFEIVTRHRRKSNIDDPYQHGSEPTLVCLDCNNDIKDDGLYYWSIYGVFLESLTANMNQHSRDMINLSIEECK